MKILKKTLPSGVTLQEAVEQYILKDTFTVSDPPSKKMKDVIYDIFEGSTEVFPYKSRRGNKYILVAYSYDVNAILSQTLKNREAKSIVDAWTIINDRLSK